MATKKKNALGIYALIAARVLLGGLLFYAGFAKMQNLPKFAEDIAHFRMLPEALSHVLAIVLPWNEIVVGSLLIFGIWSRAAALASLFLFTVFSIAVASAIARKLNINCGCMGDAGASKVGLLKLAEDAAYLAVSAYVYFATVPPKATKAKWE